MAQLGLKGRRYSRCFTEVEGDRDAYFVGLLTSGVNPKCIGRSVFSLPGFLRDVARAGLRNCFVLDMVNAHVVIQHKRHPAKPALQRYVEEREAILKNIPSTEGATEKEARDAAKQ